MVDASQCCVLLEWGNGGWLCVCGPASSLSLPWRWPVPHHLPERKAKEGAALRIFCCLMSEGLHGNELFTKHDKRMLERMHDIGMLLLGCGKARTLVLDD